MGSYLYGVSPSLEQQWREEVLYLHSLWHKGPPKNLNLKPISNNLGSSNSTTLNSHSSNLGASNSTTFKTRKNKRRVAKKKNDPTPIVSEVEWPCGPDPKPHQETGCPHPKPIVSEIEWPCGPVPEPRQETGWPQSNPLSDQATRPATAEEKAKSTALHLQQKSLKACKDFFSSKFRSDDEEEEELMDDDDESEEFKFFLGIFTADRDLRNYYEKNWESGEFCCLVCGGTGKKIWKRFKNCVALVQHSTAISKTEWRAAHRAFGKTICQVLGWEIHRLPSIVLSLDGPLGRSLAKPEPEVALKVNTAQKENLQENFVDLDDDDDDDDDDNDEEEEDDDDEEEEDDDDDEWPCGPDPEPRQETGWTQPNPVSDQATRPATSEEQIKSTALHLQQKGLQACKDFFSSKFRSDDEEEDELMDGAVDESEEFKFFLGIFTQDRDLRNYYEKNWESGEFCCLVCGGTGKKISKRFKNCVALVQHSTAISKTKMRTAHRIFGKTICRVLGWEIHRLPSIVLSLDGPLGCSLAKAEPEAGLKVSSPQKENLHQTFVDLVDEEDDDDEDYVCDDDEDDDDDDNDDDDVCDGDDDDDVELNPQDHGIGVPKEDFLGKVVDSVTVDKDERMDIQADTKKDEELGELQPEDHGTSVPKEDFQGIVADFLTVDEDEPMDIQVGSKKDEELYQKDLTNEYVEMKGAHNEEEMDCRMSKEYVAEKQEEGLQEGL